MVVVLVFPPKVVVDNDWLTTGSVVCPVLNASGPEGHVHLAELCFHLVVQIIHHHAGHSFINGFCTSFTFSTL